MAGSTDASYDTETDLDASKFGTVESLSTIRSAMAMYQQQREEESGPDVRDVYRELQLISDKLKVDL